MSFMVIDTRGYFSDGVISVMFEDPQMVLKVHIYSVPSFPLWSQHFKNFDILKAT